jgi:hypothetical protein
MFSRTFYDQDETNTHAINSAKPLRYHMPVHSDLFQSRQGIRDIDIETNIRAQPTRLNELEFPSAELFGTAPLKARNDGPVDVESMLFQGQTRVECMPREQPLFDRLVLPTPMQTHYHDTIGNESTRANYRNLNL